MDSIVLSDVELRNTKLYIALATTTLIVFDYLLTLSDEVMCIWRRKWSGVSAVFVCLRYVTLFRHIGWTAVDFLDWAHYSAHGGKVICSAANRVDAALLLLTYLNLGVFSCLRIYAIYDKNLKLALSILALAFIKAVQSAVAAAWPDYVPSPAAAPGWCSQKATRSQAHILNDLAYVGAACGLLAEFIVQVVTWRQTLSLWRSLRELNMPQPLPRLMLRDGTLTYTCIFLYTIVSSTPPATRVGLSVTPVISIVLCRLMLQLRLVYLADDGIEGQAVGSLHIPSRIVANAGAPLSVLFAPQHSSSGSDTSDSSEPVVYEDAGFTDDNAESEVYVKRNPLAAGFGVVGMCDLEGGN